MAASSQSSSQPLPEPASEACFVKVAAFDTGDMTSPNSVWVRDLPGQVHLGSWRFFISHPSSGTKLWFDLGMSDDLTQYPDLIRNLVHKFFGATPAPNSVLDDLKSLGEDPKDVKHVIVSHWHWDHIFPVTTMPNATLLCGPGTLGSMPTFWPDDSQSEYDSRVWDPKRSTIPVKEIPSAEEAPEKWTPLGTFEKAYDFFGDGSFFLVDTPGHVIGNLAALCRTKNKEGELRWLLLAGDCLHSQHFIHHPDAPFGLIPQVPSRCCHKNPQLARQTIRKIAALRARDPRVFVWAAHAGSLEGIWEF